MYYILQVHLNLPALLRLPRQTEFRGANTAENRICPAGLPFLKLRYIFFL